MTFKIAKIKCHKIGVGISSTLLMTLSLSACMTSNQTPIEPLKNEQSTLHQINSNTVSNNQLADRPASSITIDDIAHPFGIQVGHTTLSGIQETLDDKWVVMGDATDAEVFFKGLQLDIVDWKSYLIKNKQNGAVIITWIDNNQVIQRLNIIAPMSTTKIIITDQRLQNNIYTELFEASNFSDFYDDSFITSYDEDEYIEADIVINTQNYKIDDTQIIIGQYQHGELDSSLLKSANADNSFYQQINHQLKNSNYMVIEPKHFTKLPWIKSPDRDQSITIYSKMYSDIYDKAFCDELNNPLTNANDKKTLSDALGDTCSKF